MTHPKPYGAKRRWRKMDCVGQCYTTGGFVTGGADVHESFGFKGTWYADCYKGRHLKFWPKLMSLEDAKRACERWLNARTPSRERVTRGRGR